MTVVPISWFLILGAILFTIGTIGVLVRRNVIVIFLSIELMLNAVNLLFLTYGRMRGDASSHVIVFFVIAIAAAEAAVGLAVFVALFRARQTIEVDRINLLKW